jgi:hypothetical protein
VESKANGHTRGHEAHVGTNILSSLASWETNFSGHKQKVVDSMSCYLGFFLQFCDIKDG